MTSQLIPVFPGVLAGQPAQLVCGRELHAFLNVGRDLSTWLTDRITQYSFREHEDYKIVFPKTGGNPLPNETRAGGRPTKDYHLTLDMAKELAMIERTPKGREARRYFIQCEKELLAIKDGAPLEPPEDPPFVRLDAGLMRELRRVNPRLVQGYLMAWGITPAYLTSLLGAQPPMPVMQEVSDIAPVDHILARIKVYTSNEDNRIWYLLRPAFEQVCEPYNMRETAQWLRELGCLASQNGRLTLKAPKSLFPKRPYVFAVLKTLAETSGLATVADSMEGGLTHG